MSTVAKILTLILALFASYLLYVSIPKSGSYTLAHFVLNIGMWSFAAVTSWAHFVALCRGKNIPGKKLALFVLVYVFAMATGVFSGAQFGALAYIWENSSQGEFLSNSKAGLALIFIGLLTYLVACRYSLTKCITSGS